MSSSTASYTPRDGDPVLPLFSLRKKTAIVSGAGAGIGLAVADALAEAGADVVIWYNSNIKAITRAQEISERWGVKCEAFKVDVTKSEEVEKAVREQAQGVLGGRLDVFVANAGIPWTMGPILEAGEKGVRYPPPPLLCSSKLTLTRSRTTTASSRRTSTPSTTVPWPRANTSRDKATAPSSPPHPCPATSSTSPNCNPHITR